MKKIIYTFVLGIMSMHTINAQTLLGENFNYTAGDSLTNLGWVSFSGGTTNAILVNNGGLTFTGHVGSGIGNSVRLATTGQDVYKDLSTPVSSGSVYASALINVDTSQSTGDYSIALLPSTSTTAFFARLYIRRSSANHYRVSISKASTAPTVYSNDSFAYGVTYLSVIKYQFYNVSTTDDSVSVYYLSNIPNNEPSVPTFGPVVGSQTDATNIGRFALRQGTASSAARLTVDAIRVGTTWSVSPLPVQLASFHATRNNTSNNIHWTTASETNNKGFEVQRSVNGGAFETIAFVHGAGNSNRSLDYQFKDADANQSVENCYRLKQIDFDGTNDYSNVACIAAQKLVKQVIDVKPNPFNNEINLSIQSEKDGLAIIELIDVVGKVQLVKNVAIVSGNNQVTFETTQMKNGIYFIRINQHGQITTKRLIKN